MKKNGKLITGILLIPLLFGCTLFTPPTIPTPQPTASPDVTPSPVTTIPTQTAQVTQRLTEEMLANFTYTGYPTPDGLLPLQNGQFEMSQENPPIRVTSRLMASAFGDLNRDAVEDAVAILATNTGGSGTFFDLIALTNQNGTPLQVASSNIGDRQVIKDVRIEDNRIILDYMTQSPQDGLCCPSQHNLRTYELEGGSLILTSEQLLESEAVQATPLPNRIYIDRPQPYEKVYANTFEVRGRVSQTPPNGELTYNVTDLSQNLLQQGIIPVSGKPGDMGTYSIQLELDRSTQNMVTIEVIDTENFLLFGRSIVTVLLP